MGKIEFVLTSGFVDNNGESYLMYVSKKMLPDIDYLWRTFLMFGKKLGGTISDEWFAYLIVKG